MNVMGTSDRGTEPVTADELLARSRALAPVLTERAVDCEAARRVPDESIQDFHAADLIRMTQPACYGGHEMGWDVLCDVAQSLSAADGAQAWVQAIMADHAQFLGTFPPDAQADVWGRDPDAVLSASFEPAGKAVPEAGGFRLSGRYGFASGIDHADWLICGGFIVDGESRDGPHFFLVPGSDACIIDDWNTIGLEGTGSKSFEIDGAFVPAHRFLDGEQARIGTGPGTRTNTAAVYRLPRGSLTACLFAAMSVGMAQGVLREWLIYTRNRKSRGKAMDADPGSHIAAGQTSAEIAAAEALYRNTIRDGMRILEAGGSLTESEMLAAKRNCAYACKLSLEAGTRLFNAAGGRAIFRGSALERQYRNLLASAAHFIVGWEGNAIAAGADLIASAE